MKYFGTEKIPEDISEIIDDSISEVINGVMVLPDTEYVYFATKKQTLAKDHIWIGPRKKNGKPLKGLGMYFGRSKK